MLGSETGVNKYRARNLRGIRSGDANGNLALSYLAQAHWHHFRYRIGAMVGLDRARREASGRPRFGSGKSGFAKPKDDADRLKQGMPYKYRVKKSGFLVRRMTNAA